MAAAVKEEVEKLTGVARRGLGEQHLLPDVCSPGGGTQRGGEATGNVEALELLCKSSRCFSSN